MTLSPQALQVIHDYLHLAFRNGDVSCPYYNNRRQRVHGALRVMVGKGCPKEIVDEAYFIALKERLDLATLDTATLKKFLIDNNLGIDCSALVYYVLEAEVLARKRKKLSHELHFPYTFNPLRKLLLSLRPIENTNVKILAHEKNSVVIQPQEIQPGDMIVMIKTGVAHDRDHVLVIHEIHGSEIHYTHALAWPSDGKYGHGVRQGKITLSSSASLLDAVWEEQSKKQDENDTFRHAKNAQILEIRRLRGLLA